MGKAPRVPCKCLLGIRVDPTAAHKPIPKLGWVQGSIVPVHSINSGMCCGI